MSLPVSGLSVVLVAQWAGEALTLFPLRHQLQSADELGLAHTVSWTIADNYKIWTLTCRNKSSLLIMLPISFSLCFVLVCALHPFSFWMCCCVLRNLRQVSAASHSQVRRPGKLGTI